MYNKAIRNMNSDGGHMNISQVLDVLAVAKYQNFSRAAEHLFLSQPALSQQVRKLEEELGCTLFLRTPQGVCLTAEGERFCQSARQVAQGWQELQQVAGELTARPVEPLRVGLGARVYSNGLFDPVVAYFDAHPEVEVTFITDISGSILEELEEGRMDVALDRLPPPNLIPGGDRFYWRELLEERQCILLSRDDPRSRQEHLSFRDLQGSTLVTGAKGSLEDRIMMQDCRDYGITLVKSYRSDNISTIMGLVRRGKGFVIGPKSFVEYFGVAAVPMLPEVHIALSFICLRKKAQDPCLASFLAYLTELCREKTMPTSLLIET